MDPVTTAALGSGAPREPEMVTSAQTAEQARGRQTTEVLLTRQVCASVRPDCQQRRNSKLAGWVLWHLGCLPDTVEMACGQWGILRERSRAEAYIWIAQQRPAIWAKCKAPKEPTIERWVEEGEWSQERDSTAMRQETTRTWVVTDSQEAGGRSGTCWCSARVRSCEFGSCLPGHQAAADPLSSGPTCAAGGKARVL